MKSTTPSDFGKIPEIPLITTSSPFREFGTPFGVSLIYPEAILATYSNVMPLRS